MTTQDIENRDKPRLLFVDDEQRVLNSMRIMFRRQFNLYLASDGPQALEIVKNKDIDVIVADHRMPQMTGVEVLTKVRTMSPRTVRILLTGYADLDAVEGSINDGEVFRFLTKPCAPDQLRETIGLAAKLAREAPSHDTFEFPQDELSDENVLEIIMESDTAEQIESPSPSVPKVTDFTGTDVIEQPLRDFTGTDGIRKPAPVAAKPASAHATPEPDFTATDVIAKPPTIEVPPPKPAPAARKAPKTTPGEKPRLAAGLGIVVFSTDDNVIGTVQNAVRGRLPVYTASNVVKVVKVLTDHRPGVLVTDISDDKATIQAMTARLKEHLPELVTIAVSEHRDVLDMVWLINHGQIFRFLRKPLSSGRCAISLQAALKHHRMLLRNPDMVKRHEVAASEEGGLVDGMLSKLKNMKRLWASA